MPPQNLQVDRHATMLAKEGAGNDDDLITSKELARWLRVSISWVEQSRKYSYGPPVIYISKNAIRYKRADVLAWLAERAKKAEDRLYGGAAQCR